MDRQYQTLRISRKRSRIQTLNFLLFGWSLIIKQKRKSMTVLFFPQSYISRIYFFNQLGIT